MDISIDHIGEERQPVIIIDDFVADPAALRASAEMLSFAPMGRHYPGIRANVAAGVVAAFLAPVQSLIAETFGFTAPTKVIEAMYSLVTTPPAQLTPIQRLPHFDGFEPERIALLHYLSDARHGGTAFYRHRSTGFESITQARHTAYNAALHKDVAAYGLPDAAYICGDTLIYEQIARYEAKPNRALIYHGHALHCADLQPGVPLSTDPCLGRLTVNTFLMGGI